MINIETIKSCIKTDNPNEEISKILKNNFEISKYNINDVYFIIKYIYLFCNEGGKFDLKIKESLEFLLNNGLSYNKNKEIFLDVLCILSELCFKYGLYKHTNNYLLLLRENYHANDLPTWVFNYSAKIYFKDDISLAYKTPEVIISFITKKRSLNLNENLQGINILKEFLNELSEWIKKQAKEKKFFDFENILNLYETIKNYLDLVSIEWNQFLECLIESYKNIENKRLEYLDFLFNLNVFSQIILEKTRQYNELYEKYILLEQKYNEIISKNETSEDIKSKNLKRIKILVLGASQIKERHIFGIAKDFKINKEQLDLKLDYDKNKRFDINQIKYKSPYAGILVGPIAHKLIGLGDYNSLIEKLQFEDGFPPFQVIKTSSGELKVTKSAFAEALDKLLIKVNANIPL